LPVSALSAPLRSRAPMAGRRSRRAPAGGAGRSRRAPTGVPWRSRVTRARLTGLAVALACSAGVGWLVTDDRFVLDNGAVELSGLHYSDGAAVRAAIGLPPDGTTSVFLLRTVEMRRALGALPTVAAVDVRAALPHRLIVAITERTPVLLVNHAGSAFLVDGDGVVLEQRPAGAPQITDLPLIDDRRVQLATAIGAGERIDAIDSAAMLELAALTPALVGSNAARLAVSVDDQYGYMVSAVPAAWRAVFGHYTPTLRPPDIIARQVQCLRSLLAGGEGSIETVYLAPADDRCGTYLPVATPRISVSPAPPS
jgi:cell division septal protein FtsQ